MAGVPGDRVRGTMSASVHAPRNRGFFINHDMRLMTNASAPSGASANITLPFAIQRPTL